MLKKTTPFIFVMLCLLVYLGYSVWTHDNRSAANLSSYCHIDFKGLNTPNSTIGATLELTDYRYSPKPFTPNLIIYIDNKAYPLYNQKVYQTPASYSLVNLTQNSFAKYQNRLFIEFPLNILKALKNAQTVQLSFNYQQTSTIVLPLSAVDLKYWQNQLSYLH